MSMDRSVLDAVARNVRSERTRRNMTLEALAARSGVSRNMLIQIEQARTNPTVGILDRVAEALGVALASLVDGREDRSPRVVPPEEALRLRSTPGGGHADLYFGSGPPSRSEFWRWHLTPGDLLASDAHPPGTHEILYVVSGRLTLTVGPHEAEAPAGSALAFEADRSHAYENRGDEDLRFAMTLIHPPTTPTA